MLNDCFRDSMSYGLRNAVDETKEMCRAALARPVDKGEGKADTEGWIEWKGGECPVAANTLVNIKTRTGYMPPDVTEPASEWDWQHDDGISDIIAYRLAPTQGKDEG